MTADGDTVATEAQAFFLNHTQYFGKGMRACPHALWDDGLFDMAWFSHKRRGAVLRIFGAIQTGAHDSLVETRQAKQCVLELPCQEGLFNLDGEVVRYVGGKITIECVPRAYRLLAPVQEHTALG